MDPGKLQVHRTLSHNHVNDDIPVAAYYMVTTLWARTRCLCKIAMQRAGGIDQRYDAWPSMCKAMGSTPSTETNQQKSVQGDIKTE
jgi:hypothetical protein